MFKLKGRTILAPMASVTDAAFRHQAILYGASYTITELISIEGLLRRDEHSLFLAQKAINEKPFGVQLFGSDPKSYVQALEVVEKQADVIDLNIGCPANKVMIQKAGCWLMKEDKKLKEIIEGLVSVTKLPVTAKIRKGVKLRDNDAIKVAKVVEKAGGSAITVHPRTQEQGYSGLADWQVIKDVKKAVSIPVIGNGDVTSPEKALEMINFTNCDYVMIGRAARGNPYIFTQINDYLKKGNYKELSDEEKLSKFAEYCKLAEKYNIPFIKVKGHAMQFTKGTHQAKNLREEMIKIKSIEELKRLL